MFLLSGRIVIRQLRLATQWRRFKAGKFGERKTDETVILGAPYNALDHESPGQRDRAHRGCTQNNCLICFDTAAVIRVVTRASWRGRILCAAGRDRTAVSPLAQLSSSVMERLVYYPIVHYPY